jgi:3-methyladenine DNA glycosylase AlkD
MAGVDQVKPAKLTYRQAHAAVMALADAEKGKFLQRFFKTGQGEYGEGDRFLGITVPAIRRLAKTFRELGLSETERVLQSPYNEERLLALIILDEQYRRGDPQVQQAVVDCYLKNLHRVNNWNLVDGSAPYILGQHLLRRSRALLYRLVESSSLWDRRIAVVATFAFIREGDFADTLKLTERLLEDEEDLMHKACGWMLREVGKRAQPELEAFLKRHHRAMPRTMLRYAIERFPAEQRREFLK